METPELNSSNNSIKQKSKVWIILACLIGFSVLGYYGYCFGLWGRNNLLLQYLFQCGCPVFTEEWHYPRRVDVIVPACHSIGRRLSPTGRSLLVYEKEDRSILSTYLLDLQTKKKTPLILPVGDIYFINDDLIYIFVWYGRGNEGGEHIFDRTTNKMYPIQGFIFLQPKAYSYGKVDPVLLFKALLEVDEVFLTDYAYPSVIALSSDFRTHPEHSFTFDYSALPGDGRKMLEQFLQQNKITYHHNFATFPGEVISPDGKFIARRDGIYMIETNKKIADGYKFSWYDRPYSGQYLSVRGWKYDSSGAIYSQFIGPCLLEPPGYDGPSCIFEVPQPVVLLKVPEKYLSSTQIP
jgi:hypothetical protein